MINYRRLRHLIHQKSFVVRNADPESRESIRLEFNICTFFLIPYSFIPFALNMMNNDVQSNKNESQFGKCLMNIIFYIGCISFVFLIIYFWPIVFFNYLLFEDDPDYKPQPNCPCRHWARCKLERHLDWLHSAWCRLRICLRAYCQMFGKKAKTLWVPAETLTDIVQFIPSENAPRLWTTSSHFATHFVGLHNQMAIQLHVREPSLAELLQLEHTELRQRVTILLERIARLEQEMIIVNANNNPQQTANQPAAVEVSSWRRQFVPVVAPLLYISVIIYYVFRLIPWNDQQQSAASANLSIPAAANGVCFPQHFQLLAAAACPNNNPMLSPPAN